MEVSNRVGSLEDGSVVSLRAIQLGKVDMSIGYEEGERTMKAMGNERSYILYKGWSEIGNTAFMMH